MKPSHAIMIIVGFLGIGVLISVISPPKPQIASNKTENGYFLLHELLVRRGDLVKDLNDPKELWEGTLLITGPFVSAITKGEADLYAARVNAGSTLVLFSDGIEANLRELINVFRLSMSVQHFSTLSWKEALYQEVKIHGQKGTITVRPSRNFLECTADSDWLYGEPKKPGVCVMKYGSGKVVVAPKSLWANRYLENNLALLDILEGPVWFDVYHENIQKESVKKAFWGPFILLIAHLLLLYLVVVWAISVRFGFAINKPEIQRSSFEEELTHIGKLHEKCNHHQEAHIRLAVLAKRKQIQVVEEGDLLDFARKMGRIQQEEK